MDGFRVMARRCPTCIYRRDSPLDLARLEAEAADGHGGFRGHRVCHHSPDGRPSCCRGFWDRHRDKFPAGQIAQRLEAVTIVEDLDESGRETNERKKGR